MAPDHPEWASTQPFQAVLENDMAVIKAAGEGKRLGLLVNHTDAKREWTYDRQSSEGRLGRGLDEAEKNGWVVVDMARDWRVINPFQIEE